MIAPDFCQPVALVQSRTGAQDFFGFPALDASNGAGAGSGEAPAATGLQTAAAAAGPAAGPPMRPGWEGPFAVTGAPRLNGEDTPTPYLSSRMGSGDVSAVWAQKEHRSACSRMASVWATTDVEWSKAAASTGHVGTPPGQSARAAETPWATMRASSCSRLTSSGPSPRMWPVSSGENR